MESQTCRIFKLCEFFLFLKDSMGLKCQLFLFGEEENVVVSCLEKVRMCMCVTEIVVLSIVNGWWCEK